MGILTYLIPDPFTIWRTWRQRAWYRFKARQAARLAATAHAAKIARALYAGSTEAYTFIDDLARHPNSTNIDWS